MSAIIDEEKVVIKHCFVKLDNSFSETKTIEDDEVNSKKSYHKLEEELKTILKTHMEYLDAYILYKSNIYRVYGDGNQTKIIKGDEARIVKRMMK